MQFEGVLVGAIDGDSVWVRRDGQWVGVRVGGVDVPSSGPDANKAKRHIAGWVGRKVVVRETCCGRPHGEIPGVVTDARGNNLGLELLRFGRRLFQFPIEAAARPLPALFLKALEKRQVNPAVSKAVAILYTQ